MMKNLFRGQWKGDTSTGSFVMVNMDVQDKKIRGRVSVLENILIDEKLLSIWIWSFFDGSLINNKKIKGTLYRPSIHHRYGEYLTNKELEELQDKTGIEFPDTTTFTGTLKNETTLDIDSISKYSTAPIRKEKFKLKKKKLVKSKIKSIDMTWNKFKEYALEQDDGLIYRGQAGHWPLQTSYHRTGYADLVSYLDSEIPELEHHINSISAHPYDVIDDRSLGALLNLAQHHGYPTPLLDWSKSPYVAAFFAFENEENLIRGGKVSIYVFNEKKWAEMAGRKALLKTPHMTVRTMELPGFGNARVLPQQSITMYSNVDDIEDIIQSNENEESSFIKRITISSSSSKIAMHELNLMGITWASMFPGFDGVCKQLTSRHFK